MKKLVLAILLTMASYISFATDILISDVPETDAFQIDCESSASESTTTTFFLDDGGESNYTIGRSYIRDIQSANGSIISVKFVNFNLANGTLLTIKDAVTREVLVANATGRTLQGQTITSHHGKLRFVWTSGANTSAGFKAKVWCGSPCQQFTTTITSSIDPTDTETGQYYDVCKNTAVEFTAHNVFLNNNQEYQQTDDNLTYNWLIFSRNDTLRFYDAGRTFSHTFAESGGYYVMCDAIDGRGCASHEANTVRVRVSIAPTWENVHFTPDTICSGTEVTFTISPYAEPWRDEVPNVVGGATFLPDGTNECYNTSINPSSFDEAAIINSVDDIDRIYINMEHSYLGDLSILLQCPNGQQCLLKAYQNRGRETMNFLQWRGWENLNNINSCGGGNIHLGLAPDPMTTYSPRENIFSNCYLIAGEGYSYYFTPTATTNFGYRTGSDTNPPTTTTTYTDPCGETQTTYVLDPGEYATYESMSSLIGCPLNGEWTLYVCDHLGLDNGWIFEWGIFLNEDVFPADLWEFENTYSEDGFFWEGGNDFPDIPHPHPYVCGSTGPANNGNVPSGSEMYDAVVTKNGSLRDTDDNLTYIVTDRPQNPDLNNPALIPYTFSVTDDFGCTYDTTVTVYVLPAGDPTCCVTPLPEISVSDTMPCTNSVTLTASDFDLQGNSGEWTYTGPGTAIFTAPDQPQTDVSVNVYGDYTFTWHEYYLGNLGCSGEASINVNFAQQMDATLSSVDNCCHSASPIVLNAPDFGSLSCIPYTPALNADARTFTPNLALPGEYTITNTISNQRCASPAVSSVTFQVYDEISVSNRTESCSYADENHPMVDVAFNVRGLDSEAPTPTYNVIGFYTEFDDGQFGARNTDSIIATNQTSSTYTFSGHSALDYALTVSDEHGCSNVSVAGYYACECPYFAGTFADYSPHILCTGGTFDVGDQNVGHRGDQNDAGTLSYIICSDPNHVNESHICTLSASTQTIALANIPNGREGIQYYIVAVEGQGEGLAAWTGTCRSASQAVPLMWKASPMVTATAADTCGLVIQLNGSEPTNGMHGYWTASAPDGITNYSFTTIEGTTNTDYNAKVLSSHYGPITYTWHIVNSECTGTASAVYNFRQIPSPNAGPDMTVCGVTAEITGANPTTPTIGGSTLQWTGHGVVISNASTIQPTVSANGSGTYSIQLTERNGECAGSDYMNITFVNIPSPATTSNVDTVCGYTAELQVYNANPANEVRWTAYDMNNNVLPTVIYHNYNNPQSPSSNSYTHCLVTVPIPDDVSEVEYIFRW